ncbi:class I SAM-dependent methyltransferase [Kordiimonas sp.]|uniref:class I SAM-dependent methyltransferase n=1 Tax=Kordiimonas sp. TaxID=1970157 RepID=UPI003A902F90
MLGSSRRNFEATFLRTHHSIWSVLMTGSVYYTNINQDLLGICPDAEKVLEFGCSSGRFMGAYKERVPHAYSVGVELFEVAAQEARQTFEKVLIGNAENLDLETASLEKNYFDLMIYGDVIEHFADPWKAIKYHLEFLKPGGTVCICIPNASHWSMIYELYNGHFRYQDQGLLDRTHLRFFTRSTFMDLLNNAGLEVELCRSIIVNENKTRRSVANLAKLLDKTPEQVHPARVKDWSTYQYLFRATKPA